VARRRLPSWFPLPPPTTVPSAATSRSSVAEYSAVPAAGISISRVSLCRSRKPDTLCHRLSLTGYEWRYHSLSPSLQGEEGWEGRDGMIVPERKQLALRADYPRCDPRQRDEVARGGATREGQEEGGRGGWWGGGLADAT